MAKRITDLTAAELDALARDAWAHEAESSLQQGLPVTYVEDGKVYRRWPDGRRECLTDKLSAVGETESGGTLDDKSQQCPHRSKVPENWPESKVLPRGERSLAQASVTGALENLRVAPAKGTLKSRSQRNEYVSGWHSGRRRGKAHTADD